MKDRIRVLWAAVIVSLVAFAGIAVADDFSEGCVSCHVEKIGDVIFYKALRASKDGREMMRRGIRTRFGGASY